VLFWHFDEILRRKLPANLVEEKYHAKARRQFMLNTAAVRVFKKCAVLITCLRKANGMLGQTMKVLKDGSSLIREQ